MNITRAILSGVIIWVLIFLAFTIMSFIPGVKDSELIKNLILYVLLIPILIFGVKFYYKKERNTSGIIIGSIIAITGLTLDAIITIPVIILPHGGSYMSFFSDPLLWLIVVEMLIVSHLYWKIKVK